MAIVMRFVPFVTAVCAFAPAHVAQAVRRYGRNDDLSPPRIEALGHRPFTALELDALAHWLEDPGWPRRAMNIYSLEGYFVALLVMPLDLRTTIWMPSIWNESGWKIPVALQTREGMTNFWNCWLDSCALSIRAFKNLLPGSR